jgi:hypothetical protein
MNRQYEVRKPESEIVPFGGIAGAFFGACMGMVAIIVPNVGPITNAGVEATIFGALIGSFIGGILGVFVAALAKWVLIPTDEVDDEDVG